MAPTIFELNFSYFKSKTSILKIVELILCVVAVGTTTHATLNTVPGSINPISFPSVFTHVVINYAFFIKILFVLICNVLSKPAHDGTNGTILESAWNGIFAIMFLATSIAVMSPMADAIRVYDVEESTSDRSRISIDIELLKSPYVLHLTGAVFSLLNSLVLAVHTFLNAKELMSAEHSEI